MKHVQSILRFAYLALTAVGLVGSLFGVPVAAQDVDEPDSVVLLTYSGIVTPVLDRYIAALKRAGFPAEAAAVGNLYNALVRGNYTSVPLQALLLAD